MLVDLWRLHKRIAKRNHGWRNNNKLQTSFSEDSMGIVEFSKLKENIFSGLTHAPSGAQCFRCRRGLSDKCRGLDFQNMRLTKGFDLCLMQKNILCDKFIGVVK